MEQKAVAEVGSICFSKVLPEKNWNVKLELNWQLSKIYFLKKGGFQNVLKRDTQADILFEI